MQFNFCNFKTNEYKISLEFQFGFYYEKNIFRIIYIGNELRKMYLNFISKCFNINQKNILKTFILRLPSTIKSEKCHIQKLHTKTLHIKIPKKNIIKPSKYLLSLHIINR